MYFQTIAVLLLSEMLGVAVFSQKIKRALVFIITGNFLCYIELVRKKRMKQVGIK
jgi:hypothetical protein